MATARKTSKAAVPAIIEAAPEAIAALPAPAAPENSMLPALQETVEATLEATLGKASALQEQLRQAAEQGLDQSKLVYERARAVAEDASASLETSIKAVSQGVTDINVKTVEALQASADAQFAFVKALLSTRSISDLISLQGEHARQQFEAMNAAAKDLSNLIQKVSTQSVEPIKSTISKSLTIAA